MRRGNDLVVAAAEDSVKFEDLVDLEKSDSENARASAAGK